jgi:hypothetical protein
MSFSSPRAWFGNFRQGLLAGRLRLSPLRYSRGSPGRFAECSQLVAFDVGHIPFLEAEHQLDAPANIHRDDGEATAAGSFSLSLHPEFEDPAAQIRVAIFLHRLPQLGIADAKSPRKT